MKISVNIICKNEKGAFLEPCLRSALKIADELIITDTGSTDGTEKEIETILTKWNDKNIPYKILHYDWQKPEDYTNARNHGIKECTGDYILNLDADEVLGDRIVLIPRLLEEHPEIEAWSFFGEHFIYDLTKRDMTIQPHRWVNRLTKNIGKIPFYPFDTMHGLPHPSKLATFPWTLIYHYSYVKSLCHIRDQYNFNLKNPTIHTKEQLEEWKNAHIFGAYKIAPFNPREHPTEIKEHFNFPPEFMTLVSDKIEPKHYYEMKQYNALFHPNKILDVGCGFGQRLICAKETGIGKEHFGCDIQDSVLKSPNLAKGIKFGDILDLPYNDEFADFVLCNDVMEHLEEKDVDKALKELHRVTSNIVAFSICFEEMWEQYFDPTHKTKHKKDWWENKIKNAGFEIIETPNLMLFSEQKIFAKKKEVKK